MYGQFFNAGQSVFKKGQLIDCYAQFGSNNNIFPINDNFYCSDN